MTKDDGHLFLFLWCVSFIYLFHPFYSLHMFCGEACGVAIFHLFLNLEKENVSIRFMCFLPSSFLLDLIWNRPLLPIITYAARRWSSLNRQNLSTVVLVVLFSTTLFIRVFVKLVAVKYLGCLVDQQGPYSIQIARKEREREEWGGSYLWRS